MNVTVYSTRTCPYCHMAKDFLAEKKIAFKDVDVLERYFLLGKDVDVGSDQKAAEEMVKKSGQMGVPVIEIDGKIIVGFDKPAIEAALGL